VWVTGCEMTRWSRLPIRSRLSITFGALAAVVVAGLSIVVYSQTGVGLLATIDANLSSRAYLLVSSVKDDGPSQVNVGPQLIENVEVFAQIDDASGRVLRSTSLIARSRLLPAAQVRSLRRAKLYDRTVPGIANVTRVLAVPVLARRGRLVVAVGTSLQDRHEALVQLAATLAMAGSAALLLITASAWLALAGALRPVERMRRQAAEISASDPGRRLSPAGGNDEIALLGATLNQMLDRVEESVNNERRLVDRASHELRSPLAIQRIDLDVALSGPQTVEELTNALASVSVENAHLTRLTEDLLLLSRARAGVLPVQLADVALPELLEDARRRHGVLNGGDVGVSFHSPDRVVRVDPVWFRQAVDNLLDNALRHTPPGGRIEVRADQQGDKLTVVVDDTGPGFDKAFIGRAFEPFTRWVRDPDGQRGSAGLGLAVVSTIAQAHGGRAWAENRPDGGARVTMMMDACIAHGQPADS
jgi:two-component system, OmpR family, sensor kinase